MGVWAFGEEHSVLAADARGAAWYLFPKHFGDYEDQNRSRKPATENEIKYRITDCRKKRCDKHFRHNDLSV
jgi:hypothetical protein